MGRSVTARLAYGYDLGGANQWHFNECEGYGDITLDWYDKDGDEFITQAEALLLASAAEFTETDWRADGYYERRRKARGQLDVKFGTHGYGEEPDTVLAAHVTTAQWEGPAEVDLADLERRRVAEDWDGKLAAALAALGITPTQDGPRWLLMAYEG